jgi:hypothetical protein
MPTVPATDLTEHLITLERRALERWCHGDPSGFLEISAPDVVYFDPFIDQRIDGLAALTQYYEALRGQVSADSFELLAPRVLRAGPMAVLTFNFESAGVGGRMRWNCTEVFRDDPSGWRIVQTHWSLTKPRLAQG